MGYTSLLDTLKKLSIKDADDVAAKIDARADVETHAVQPGVHAPPVSYSTVAEHARLSGLDVARAEAAKHGYHDEMEEALARRTSYVSETFGAPAGTSYNLRQQAKMMNFGQKQAMGAMTPQPVLTMSPLSDEECFQRFRFEQQADSGNATHVFKKCANGWMRTMPRLTIAERDRARVLWSAGVKAKTDADEADRTARTPTVICQGDWADEDENL